VFSYEGQFTAKRDWSMMTYGSFQKAFEEKRSSLDDLPFFFLIHVKLHMPHSYLDYPMSKQWLLGFFARLQQYLQLPLSVFATALCSP
jgi:hypothetical protein